MKQFFFTGGLPRSGSTLLTALLNQNPDILATNGTDLNRVFDNLDAFLPTLRGVETKEYLFEYNNLLQNLYQVFFANAMEQVIIDKIDRNGSPQSLIELLR
jgi:sulfotransferase